MSAKDIKPTNTDEDTEVEVADDQKTGGRKAERKTGAFRHG